jgi:hypothetical protein
MSSPCKLLAPQAFYLALFATLRANNVSQVVSTGRISSRSIKGTPMETFEEEAEQKDCKWLFKVRRNAHGEFERYKDWSRVNCVPISWTEIIS